MADEADRLKGSGSRIRGTRAGENRREQEEDAKKKNRAAARFFGALILPVPVAALCGRSGRQGYDSVLLYEAAAPVATAGNQTCIQQDSNLHGGCPTEPKSAASANSAMDANKSDGAKMKFCAAAKKGKRK